MFILTFTHYLSAAQSILILGDETARLMVLTQNHGDCASAL